jgi:23S rRNA (guanosine2251-2'-O)-methyltransferase
MRFNRIMSTFLIVDNVRSKQNVGSLFRTSDALRIKKIYLCGTTPTPLDRFGRPVGEIAKTALGAEKTIPWEYAKTTKSLIKKLKKESVQIIAIEQGDNSVDYKKIKPKGDFAFVLGNEVEGISKDVLKLADIVAEIPMKGEKESLNVSVAFGVAAFRVLNI